ncbi:uncharacterized protein LOC131482992 isoform X2 [Ochotona princeps]|uniref:uncharacterized protein LOC131482992 isoform X2 n=1 Tax=Ochotona princeps TaxID=9978 RepID=UPI002714FEB4|nr:uncharacterized protein LOC131482992 isoform X2 [Ochotona princeps]
MLAKLVIFVVDLMLALAISVTLYAVYLLATTGIFISVVFCLLRGDTETSCDFNKGRVWVLDSSKAAGKPLEGHTEKLSTRVLPVHCPEVRQWATLHRDSISHLQEARSSLLWKRHLRRLAKMAHPPKQEILSSDTSPKL